MSVHIIHYLGQNILISDQESLSNVESNTNYNSIKIKVEIF